MGYIVHGGPEELYTTEGLTFSLLNWEVLLTSSG